MNHLINPYDFLPDGTPLTKEQKTSSHPDYKLHRTTIELGEKDYAFARSLTSGRSALQTTINILYSKFINELKRNGITEYDPERYNAAISGVEVTIGGGLPKSVGGAVIVHPNTGEIYTNSGVRAVSTNPSPIGNSWTAEPIGTPTPRVHEIPPRNDVSGAEPLALEDTNRPPQPPVISRARGKGSRNGVNRSRAGSGGKDGKE